MRENKKQSNALFSFDYQIELDYDRKTIIPCLVSVYKWEHPLKNTYKFGVFGGAGEPDLDGRTGIGINQTSLDFSRRLGNYVGNHNNEKNLKIQPITGAPPGNPQVFAEATSSQGTFSIGISPFYDEEQHLRCGSKIEGYLAIVYLGQDRLADFSTMRGKERLNIQFGLRDGYNILAVHTGIYIGGSLGTLQELIANLQMGKDIGLAKGTGGIVDNFIDFYDVNVKKNTGSRIVVSSDPVYLTKKIISLQGERKKSKGKLQKLFIDDIIERIIEEQKNRYDKSLKNKFISS